MSTILGRALMLLTGDEVKLSPKSLKFPTRRKDRTLTERELLSLESKIGASLFGPLAKGRRREFFCLDERTWIWYEEWYDDARVHHTATTRYEIQDHAILKVQEGSKYSYVEGQERANLLQAIDMYYERVMREIYGQQPRPLTSTAAS